MAQINLHLKTETASEVVLDAADDLHLDAETASELDLKEVGLDNYMNHPSTRILMLGWAVNDALPDMWFPHEGPLPDHLRLLLERPEIHKHAFNSEFERTLLLRKVGIDIPARCWSDPMITARYASIAGNLAFVGKVLRLADDEAKMAAGKKLISFFCKPRKDGKFNDHLSHPEKWAEFVEYCKRDIIAERAQGRKLKAFSLPPKERKIFELDQKINEHGIPVDMTFATNGTKIVATESERLIEKMRALTGLENPNSPKKLLAWVKEEGYPYNSLGKDWIVLALGNNSGVGFQNSPLTEKGREALELRQQVSKSSTAKLVTLANVVSEDGFLRNQYVYYGAARTGRWSGRSVQMQNLKRGSAKYFDEAVEAIRAYRGLEDMPKIREFGEPIDVVSNCIKGAFRAPKGKIFVACDLSTIEVRMLGWLADCPAINNVFANGRDCYKDFGTRLYKKAYEDITKDERQVCKPAVLQCGYQAGGGELKKDKAGNIYKSGLWGYLEEYGVTATQQEAADMVSLYRESYPEVVSLWRKCENAAIKALQTGEPQQVGRVVFGAVKPCRLLWIKLPSGRALFYIRPNLEVEEVWSDYYQCVRERTKLTYEGIIEGKIWGRKHTYGGHWVENLCQATARDVLVEGMLAADADGFTIIGSTHDEIWTVEDEAGIRNLDVLRKHMVRVPEWAPDLMLDADGWMDHIYRKEAA